MIRQISYRDLITVSGVESAGFPGQSEGETLSSLFVKALGAISRSFGDRQWCAWAWRHHRLSLVCPHRASCFHLNPQSWILTTSITGHRQREQEYGYLSYFHHVVLGLDEVDRLVHTVIEELGTRGLTTPFFFSSTLPEFVASKKSWTITSRTVYGPRNVSQFALNWGPSSTWSSVTLAASKPMKYM